MIVVTAERGSTRYRLLETVKLSGRRRWDDDQRRAMHDRHLAWLIGVVDETPLDRQLAKGVPGEWDVFSASH